MYLVTKGKTRENILGYDNKTKEYVYLKNGKEVWREKGDMSLLDYFTDLRTNYETINESKMKKLPTYKVWKKYCDSCFK